MDINQLIYGIFIVQALALIIAIVVVFVVLLLFNFNRRLRSMKNRYACLESDIKKMKKGLKKSFLNIKKIFKKFLIEKR
jgi:hypothetical protein